jgi:hypothetical protein
MKRSDAEVRQENDTVIRWLLDGDPAIRWQVLRDLLEASERTVERERRKIEREGWGARLLARQDPGGTWSGGLYNPKWMSTTYTMLLLRDFGLHPSNRQTQHACPLLLANGMCADGGVNLEGNGRSEACIDGMVLSLLSYFQCDDPRVDVIAGHLLQEQMPDGGWNCRRPRGATHSSVHTTIIALEGLHHYELFRRTGLDAVRRAQQRAREFLLVHRLFRSHRTGNVIKSEFTRLYFPPRWHYDILRALDYFRAVNAPCDHRVREAIEILQGRRGPDGRWSVLWSHKGRVHFELERIGGPSRWNTLRALRVLKWWDEKAAAQKRTPR